MDEGVKLSSQYVNTFVSILNAEDIPLTMMWDSMVTDSTTPPFSEKLMMFHTNIASRAGTMEYGLLQTQMLRHDLIAQLITLLPGTMKFAEDGIKIMIKNGWLEEPPRLVDRNELINRDSH